MPTANCLLDSLCLKSDLDVDIWMCVDISEYIAIFDKLAISVFYLLLMLSVCVCVIIVSTYMCSATNCASIV